MEEATTPKSTQKGEIKVWKVTQGQRSLDTSPFGLTKLITSITVGQKRRGKLSNLRKHASNTVSIKKYLPFVCFMVLTISHEQQNLGGGGVVLTYKEIPLISK